jgi:hypothetical protein
MPIPSRHSLLPHLSTRPLIPFPPSCPEPSVHNDAGGRASGHYTAARTYWSCWPHGSHREGGGKAGACVSRRLPRSSYARPSERTLAHVLGCRRDAPHDVGTFFRSRSVLAQPRSHAFKQGYWLILGVEGDGVIRWIGRRWDNGKGVSIDKSQYAMYKHWFATASHVYN